MPRILVVDDQAPVRSALAALCRALGHETREAASGSDALDLARRERFDVVLLDVARPEPAGFEALSALVALEHAPSVIMLSAAADVTTAVRAMHSGACDCLAKPVASAVLSDSLARALQTAPRPAGDRERARPAAAADLEGASASPILGTSRAIREVLTAVERVAATPRTTVLITGESGTGKELVARAIHDRSRRAGGPFVAVNCAALSSALIEAELFGYEGGAFTGARPKGHPGLIAAAEGGSLFLDEIGELDPLLQAKLLRVLQERVYRRVGADMDRAMDVRIVASTNRDLPAMVAAGTFREDLFYRLNVMSIRLPALRERKDDVELLATSFLMHFEREFGRTFEPIDAATLEELARRPWPGNVRELRNTIERAALLAHEGRIAIEAAPVQARAVAPTADAGAGVERSIAGVERALIVRVLAESAGNRSRAARVLGVNRTTLYNKLRTYAIAD